MKNVSISLNLSFFYTVIKSIPFCQYTPYLNTNVKNCKIKLQYRAAFNNSKMIIKSHRTLTHEHKNTHIPHYAHTHIRTRSLQTRIYKLFLFLIFYIFSYCFKLLQHFIQYLISLYVNMWSTKYILFAYFIEEGLTICIKERPNSDELGCSFIQIIRLVSTSLPQRIHV